MNISAADALMSIFGFTRTKPKKEDLKMKYKIVDVCTGDEDHRIFTDKDVAAHALMLEQKELAVSRPHASHNLEVVSAETDWYFDPRQNKYIWG